MIRLWYDQNGAQLGTPWKVEVNGATPFFAARVEVVGRSRMVFRPTEAPNGVLEASGALVFVDGKEIEV